MGITTEQFFEEVYSVIFSPKEFFERETEEISIRLGASVVSFMTIINKFAYALSDSASIGFSFIFELMGAIIFALIAWGIVALFFEYTAKIFDKGGHLAKFLYLSAFSTIPALFFAPLHLVKQMGELGYIMSVAMGCLLYVWIIILYVLALKSSYNTTSARAFMFLFLPIISSVLAIYQIAGFCKSMWYIFSV